jgi:acyl-coenzyme A synthetase/AMP-(fatty) acid ligase
LKYRAESCQAVAFIGDSTACSRFEEISKSVNITKIYQVNYNDNFEGEAVGNGRIDYVTELKKIGKIENEREAKAIECEHSKTDLSLVFFTSGTTSQPKLVLLEAEYSESVTSRKIELELISVFRGIVFDSFQ